MKEVLGLAAIGVGAYFLYEWYMGSHPTVTGQVNVSANASRPTAVAATGTSAVTAGTMPILRGDPLTDIPEVTEANRAQSRIYGMRGLGFVTRADMLYQSPTINQTRQTISNMNYGESVTVRKGYA